MADLQLSQVNQSNFVVAADQDINNDVDSDDSGHDDNNVNFDVPKKRMEIARTESKIVWYTRLLLLIALVASALAVSLTLYFYLSADEKNDFEAEYQFLAGKILEG